MIDTHIHLIPGVDDGAKDLAEAIQMLNFASAEGVSEMILTPHFNLATFHDRHDRNVEAQYRRIKAYVKREKLAIKLHLGSEIYLNEEDYECIKKGQAPTMGDSRYLLLELPFYQFYPFHEEMIMALLGDYKILLAHAERYAIFEKKPEKLGEFVKKGVYVQISSGCIIDRRNRKKAFKWIEDGLVQIVASDGHNVDNRPPVMNRAYELVAGTFGTPCAKRLFVDNPRLLIADQKLVVTTENKVKRLHWLKS